MADSDVFTYRLRTWLAHPTEKNKPCEVLFSLNSVV